VAKDHNVYAWSPARYERYRELFIEPDYSVESLPGYDQASTANPFKVFEAIPPISRYRFLLDDAKFFIEGFIKGPVCRGQVALNVIEDQFWVFFLRPHPDMMTLQPDFIEKSVNYLNLPAERGDNSLRPLATWLDYLERQRHYLGTKNLFLEGYFNSAGSVLDIRRAVGLIWNGADENPNAALTVFRHYDSASVNYGLVGDYPETAWVIDYPIFERIHYLLVAGFNVYGNLTHQLVTRLYMDFLRMEAENQFLLSLPVARREQIRDSWYQGMHENVWRHFKQSQDVSMGLDTVKGYSSDDPKLELFGLLQQHLGPRIACSDPINRCESADTSGLDMGMRVRETLAPTCSAVRQLHLIGLGQALQVLLLFLGQHVEHTPFLFTLCRALQAQVEIEGIGAEGHHQFQQVLHGLVLGPAYRVVDLDTAHHDRGTGQFHHAAGEIDLLVRLHQFLGQF
jgi:hypothetical protein